VARWGSKNLTQPHHLAHLSKAKSLAFSFWPLAQEDFMLTSKDAIFFYLNF
jgi:hypothetical protein